MTTVYVYVMNTMADWESGCEMRIEIELSRCATACQGCGCSDSFI